MANHAPRLDDLDEDVIDAFQESQQAVGASVVYEQLTEEFATLAGKTFVAGEDKEAETLRAWSKKFWERARDHRRKQAEATAKLVELEKK